MCIRDRFRVEVLKSAINAYDKIKSEDERKIKPMYRQKEWQRNKRREEKAKKKKNWYTKGNYESVMFVPPTPESKLRKLIESEVRKSKFRIKIVERSGEMIIRSLQKNDPFKESICSKKEKCMVCSNSDGGNCRKTGINYEINCLGNCQYTYNGQSGHNGFTRGLKHHDDYIHKREKSSLWKHVIAEHEGEMQSFKMNVTKTYRGDPTKRQLAEAIRLRDANPQTSMNGRNEWNQIKIPRISIV